MLRFFISYPYHLVDYSDRIVTKTLSEIIVTQADILPITCIILAGGKSSRLGREKALEKISKRSLIEHTIDCLSSISQEILVVTSKEQVNFIATANLKAKLIVDSYPNKGALGGIYTGLANADAFYCLVVGCDMPFLNEALLHYLIGLAPAFDAVVPKINGMTEPLHALYSKDCLASIKQLLCQDRLAISQLFSLVKTRYVDKDEIIKYDPKQLSFFNINTQNDFLKAKALMYEAHKTSSVG